MYINTTTLTLSSENDIRSLFPNTSFPMPFIAPDDYALVFPAPQPEHDSLTQRVQAIAPELTVLGTWEQRWTVVELFETQTERDAATLADMNLRKTALTLSIDADTDAINTAVMGSRAQEYELAEKHAQAYKDAGYSGAVPHSVQSWATAKGWTPTQATDSILTTAAQWRGAQAAIRAARLLRKEQVRAATDAVGLATAMTEWTNFVVYMRGQLGLL